MGLAMAERKKIAAQFAPRCRNAGKGEKSRILDEHLALSGCKSRKNGPANPAMMPKSRQGSKCCGKTSNWPCGKLFALFLRLNLDLVRLREKCRMSDMLAGKINTLALKLPSNPWFAASGFFGMDPPANQPAGC
jgi:hypothetical protein